MRRPHLFSLAVLSCAAWLGAAAAGAATLEAGDVLATVFSDASSPARVIRIDGTTGAQEVVAEGKLLASPLGVTFGGGCVFVVDNDRVLRIDPSTGEQALLSAGGLLSFAGDLTWSRGTLYLPSFESCCTNFDSRSLVAVDPASGAQSQVIADAPYPVGGIGLLIPTGVQAEPSGTLLVLDLDLQGSFGGVARIDPRTGLGDYALILSSGPYVWPNDLALTTRGNIVVNYLNVDTRQGVIYDRTGVFLGVVDGSFELIEGDFGNTLLGLSGDTLYRTDLDTGESTPLASGGYLSGQVTDLSVVPRALHGHARLAALGPQMCGRGVGKHARR